MTRSILSWSRQTVLAIAVNATWAAASCAMAAPIYTARLLEAAVAGPGQGPEPVYTFARGINNAGQVVGRSGAGQALLWHPGTTHAQTLADPRTPEQIHGDPGAYAVNAAGLVVGGGGGRVGGGLVWRDGVGTYVPGLYEARDVNDAGVAVGFAIPDYTPRPAQWSDGVLSLLPLPADSGYGEASAINNLGVIAGWREVDGPVVTLWENGVPRSLDFSGMAMAINNRGQVAGDRDMQAFLWGPDGLSMLAALGGGWANVRGLNDDGLVVGWSSVGSSATATLWEAGQAWDLNTLLAAGALDPDWWLRVAYGINDNGWIVGDAVHRRSGEVRGFVLTPNDVRAVAEPPVLLLLGAALGLVASQRRRVGQRRQDLASTMAREAGR